MNRQHLNLIVILVIILAAATATSVAVHFFYVNAETLPTILQFSITCGLSVLFGLFNVLQLTILYWKHWLNDEHNKGVVAVTKDNATRSCILNIQNNDTDVIDPVVSTFSSNTSQPPIRDSNNNTVSLSLDNIFNEPSRDTTTSSSFENTSVASLVNEHNKASYIAHELRTALTGIV
eukprot:PhF_6_TR35197/c0_g1_i1/m.51258